NITANDLADVGRAFFQLAALLSRHLHFQSLEALSIADTVDSGKLQHHAAFVEPVFFQLQCAAASVRGQSPELTALLEAFWKIRMQIRQNFASSPLRPQHASYGDELAVYSTISSW